jgi:hypothetical protein
MVILFLQASFLLAIHDTRKQNALVTATVKVYQAKKPTATCVLLFCMLACYCASVTQSRSVTGRRLLLSLNAGCSRGLQQRGPRKHAKVFAESEPEVSW